MKLSDLYNIYLPSQMSTEIYSKLYLAILRSLQKKGTKLAVQQMNSNKRNMNEATNSRGNQEYLRSAEITEEANYNMIDGLKNNAAPKEKKNRPKESVLAKLNEKKEEVARRSGKKAMQQVMGQDMERKKN